MDMTSALFPLLKPKEVAAKLKISPSQAYARIRTGEIPSVEIAGVIRVPEPLLEEKVRAQIAASVGRNGR